MKDLNLVIEGYNNNLNCLLSVKLSVAVRKAYESGINIIGKTHAMTSFGKKLVDAAPYIKESKNTYFSSAAPRRYYDKNTLVYMKLEQIEQNDN